MAHIGTPMMNLKQAGIIMRGKQTKQGNSGPVREIVMEALVERISADPNFDPSQSYKNYIEINYDGQHIVKTEQGVFNNGKFVCSLDSEEYKNEWKEKLSGNSFDEWINAKFKNHKVIDKNGKEKKPRSDTTLAIGGILKPEWEFMKGLDSDQQDKLLKDMKEIFESKINSIGLKMAYWTVHFDEDNRHPHYGVYDDEFRIADKIGKGTNFKQWLNKGFQEELRKRGWTEIEFNDRSKEPKVKSSRPLSSREYKAALKLKQSQEMREKALESVSKAKEEKQAIDTQISDNQNTLDEIKGEINANKSLNELKREELKDTMNSLKKYEELQIDTNDVDYRDNRLNKNEVIMSKSDLKTILEQSKAYRVNKTKIIEVDRKSSEIARKEQNLKNLESKLESQRSQMAKKEQEMTRKEQKLREKEKRIDESSIVQSLKEKIQNLEYENSYLWEKVDKYKSIISDFVQRGRKFIRNHFDWQYQDSAIDELITPTINDLDEDDREDIVESLEEEFDEIY